MTRHLARIGWVSVAELALRQQSDGSAPVVEVRPSQADATPWPFEELRPPKPTRRDLREEDRQRRRTLEGKKRRR